jgi:NAD(P)-dependent dehydrogenase (short-subunit alcohol dehydrogenase family)
MGVLDGRVAAVTGAGRGIGRAVAIALAKEGARVVVNDPGVAMDGTGSDQAPADEVVSTIRSQGGEALANFESVASMTGGEAIVTSALDNFGKLDILVNVAGILRDRMIYNMSEEEWDAVIAVHLKGHFSTIRAATPLMRQQRYGRIVNFASMAGLRGTSGQANYASAKAGITGLTRTVARDMGRHGVTCNCVAPAAVTRMVTAVPRQALEKRAKAGIAAPRRVDAAKMMAGRTADHIGPMVVYLCSEEAGNINGNTFFVSGGEVSLLHEPMPRRTITKSGMWDVNELARLVPEHLMRDVRNPAPPAEEAATKQEATKR